MATSPQTPRDRFIAALERRPLTGRVPHFELVFFLTMEAFGRVHPSHRNYGQWDQMEEKERRLHRIDMAETYLLTAERYGHDAIFIHQNPGRDEELLHIVDLAPFDEGVDPVAQAKAIVGELKKYDPALFVKPRWLVLNKLDMVPLDERAARVKDFVKRFKFKGPVFEISALTREGCEPLIKAIYQHVKAQQTLEQALPEIDPRFKPEIDVSKD